MHRPKHLQKGRDEDGQTSAVQEHTEAAQQSLSTMTIASTVTPEPQYGLGAPVYEDADPTVDIIVIHGLNGDRIQTWTDPKTNVFWLRDLLPETLKAECIRPRIFSYGYNADTHSNRAISVQDLWGQGETFLGAVVAKRRKISDRPIVFIVHSLGGLVLKSALIQSNSSTTTHYPEAKALFLSTHGILFCGVPHQGGNGVSESKILINAGSIVTHTTTRIINILEPGNEVLKTQRNQYTAIANTFYTTALYETEPTIGNRVMVPYDSAVIPGQSGPKYAVPIGLPGKDHRTMVKFSSANDPAYGILSDQLIIMLEKPYDEINQRWQKWRRDLRELKYGNTLLRPRLPHAPSPRFCGRKDEIVKIEASLEDQQAGSQIVLAIYGAGGMGKTELALQYTYHHQHRYSSVIWVNAKDRKRAEASYIDALQDVLDAESENAPNKRPDYQRIATNFDIVGLLGADGRLTFAEDDDTAVERIIQALKRWFENDVHGSWLLVFDNHDDLSFRLRDFFPNCSRGCIIITSRRPDIRSYANRYHELEGLDPESAVELLLSVSERDGSNPEVRSESFKIVEKLQHLPLAIDQAAAFLARRQHLPIEMYLQRYERKWKELFEKNEHPWPDYEKTCATTWEISRQAIREQSRPASTLLQVCSFFDNDDIWGELLRRSLAFEGKSLSDDETDDLISLLSSYSLIKPKTGGDTFSIHAVVHTWARERLATDDKMFTCVAAGRMVKDAVLFVTKDSEERSAADYIFEKRVLRHMDSFLILSQDILGLKVMKNVSLERHFPEDSINCRILRHVNDAVERAKLAGVSNDAIQEDRKSSPLVGRRYFRQTDPVDPEYVKHVMDIYEIASDSLIILAKTFGRQGRHRSSAKLEATLAFFHVGLVENFDITVVLTRIAHLANQLRDLEYYREAEILFRFFLKEWPDNHDKTSSNIPAVKNGLAITLNKLGRYSEANALYKEVLPPQSGRKHFWTSDDLQVMTDSQLLRLHNEGCRLNEQGEHVEAERLFRAILPIRVSRSTVNHPEACKTLHNLALSLEKQEKLEEAERLHRQALEIRQHHLPDGHGDIIRSLNNLAVALKKRGKLDEATTLYTEALDLSTKHNGETHTGTIQIRKNRAMVWAAHKEFDRAADELATCAKALVASLGIQHPWVLNAINDWAFCLLDLKRLKGPSNLFWYVLQVRKQAAGVQDKPMNDAVRGLKTLVDRYMETGQRDQARGLETKLNEYIVFIRSRDERV